MNKKSYILFSAIDMRYICSVTNEAVANEIIDRLAPWKVIKQEIDSFDEMPSNEYLYNIRETYFFGDINSTIFCESKESN